MIAPRDMTKETKIWEPEGSPKAVVQLLHGMAEHIARYDGAARALCAAGYAVAGHNHRGHGEKAEKLGYFAPSDGWEAALADAKSVTKFLRSRFPGTPIVLFGHSMGSFLAREYAIRFSGEIDLMILSGTGNYPAPLCLAGLAAARLSAADRPALFVDKLAFSGNNKPFEPARTPFDWLSRDESQVDAYIADPLCGFPFTGQAFRDFFSGLFRLTRTGRLAAIRPSLPVYLISGECDPVGQMGQGVARVYAQFKDAGLNDVTMKLYPGARHELLNETNKDEVLHDLTAYLDGYFGGE